jgi:hypothetical protein
MKFHAPKVPLFLLFVYFATHFICFLNWWWFIRARESTFGTNLVQAHIAFCVIGTVIYVGCASPFLFWAYRHCNQMPPNLRRNAIFLCIWINFLLHDFPLWCIEFWIGWEYTLSRFSNILQAVSLTVLSFSTTIGFFGLWLGYAWKVSGLLQKSSSEAPSVALTHRGIQGSLGGGIQI